MSAAFFLGAVVIAASIPPLQHPDTLVIIGIFGAGGAFLFSTFGLAWTLFRWSEADQLTPEARRRVFAATRLGLQLEDPTEAAVARRRADAYFRQTWRAAIPLVAGFIAATFTFILIVWTNGYRTGLDQAAKQAALPWGASTLLVGFFIFRGAARCRRVNPEAEDVGEAGGA